MSSAAYMRRWTEGKLLEQTVEEWSQLGGGTHQNNSDMS